MSLPERLGRLRRIDRIGAGGFATVWLYHDDELDSPVAVKALADNWAVREDVCDRFLEEARILRRADSDHVVRVYDIGESDGTPYFVMSYADRGSVGDLLTPGALLPPARVVDLLAQAGDGLAVLHGHGVIHRDVKPQNLLIRSAPDGGERVLVADLGVAKAMLHASGLTQVVGTPAYMAPEQATGIGLDRRADVHALGAVGYHLLTGRLVREGGLGSLAAPVLPPAPSTVAPVPAAYDAPLMRALQVDPDDRWPDVGSFVAALRGAAERTSANGSADEPTRVRPAVMTDEVTLTERPPPATPDATHAPASAGPRRTGALRLVLIALLVLAATFGAAYGVTRLIDDQDDGGPSGSSSDLPSIGPAQGPTPTGSPAADIKYPTLVVPSDGSYETHTIASGDEVWSYDVPAGWVAYGVTNDGKDDGKVRPANVDNQTQLRWRPKGEPLVGGYSVRVEAIGGSDTVADRVAAKAEVLTKSRDLVGVKIYKLTDDTVYFTYVDGGNRLRYNFFRWVADADGAATFEVSVTGRKADKEGLSDLLDVVAGSATPR